MLWSHSCNFFWNQIFFISKKITSVGWSSRCNFFWNALDPTLVIFFGKWKNFHFKKNTSMASKHQNCDIDFIWFPNWETNFEKGRSNSEVYKVFCILIMSHCTILSIVCLVNLQKHKNDNAALEKYQSHCEQLSSLHIITPKNWGYSCNHKDHYIILWGLPAR